MSTVLRLWSLKVSRCQRFAKCRINAPIEICDVSKNLPPFEEVKEALKAFPSDKTAYIRFNVLIDDVVPSTLFEGQMCRREEAKLYRSRTNSSVMMKRREKCSSFTRELGPSVSDGYYRALLSCAAQQETCLKLCEPA